MHLTKRTIILIVCAAVLLFAIVGMIITLASGGTAKKIGICIYREEDRQMAQYAQQLENVLLARDYEVRILDGRNDQSIQNKQVEALVEDDFDAIIINPVMTSALTDLGNLLKEKNIPAVFINREPETEVLEGWERFSFVGTNSAGFGAMQAQQMLDLGNQVDINGDGAVSYVLLQGPLDSLDTHLRTQSILDALANSGATVNELRKTCGNGDYAQGRGVFAKALAEMGKDIEAVLCNDDMMALGAAEAIIDGGRQVGKDIYLWGMDGTPEAIESVAEGTLSGTVAQDITGMIAKTAEVLEMLLSYTKTESRYYIDPVKVTSENVKQFLGE